ncbi:substrate-binding domain-containing protein, partial [Waterburya agarophytonicola K14]
MLHKTHNSIVTLAAVLLALVGVSKPAKAFLLAQADVTPTTFNVPDKLPAKATVEMATSNSTSSINQSLKESFISKYPEAEVNIQTKSSEDALKALSEGKVELAGIGRTLTAAEKQKGLVAVPISREKIAIFISKDNPFDGSLTISQFAQIFRGEITNWSEIGGNPGEINLVDSPDTNDTRQAFPNYPVFKESEFASGANATKLEVDSVDRTIEELGPNGIAYAVANDVIDRDDIKIVTMHQTQPDDERYPFSQPFYLVYQGEPSEATEAFLGFATSPEGGEQIISNRVGSMSTAAAIAIASKLGSDRASNLPTGAVNLPKTTVDGEGNIVQPDVAGTDTDTDANTGDNVAGTDTNSNTNTDIPGVGTDTDANAGDNVAGAGTDTDADAGDNVAGTSTDTDADAGDNVAGTS